MLDTQGLDSPPTPSPDAAYRLYQGAVGALALATCYVIWKDGGQLSFNFFLGLAILYLSALPSLLWAKFGRPWFPAFEITMLSCAAFYAVPLLGNHPELSLYPDKVINQAAGLVVAYLVAANFAFLGRANPVRPSSWAVQTLLPDNVLRYLPLGVVLNTAYLYVNTFTNAIPYEISGTLRALFFGMGMVSTFVMGRLWGLDRLDRRLRGIFAVNMLLQLIFLLAELYLVRAISLLALGFIAYASARRRIPWLVIALVVPCLGLLHIGKSEMRRIYWEEGKPMPTLTELPEFFGDWVTYSLEGRAEEDPEKHKISLLERASLIQMLCLSVDRVPDLRPYLAGESYWDIPALFIPRFVWPDKPSSLLANIRLAVHFNLVDPDDAFKVSIAFGIIAEAYCNFGILGPPILGLIIGFGFRRIAMLSQSAPQFSALGILMILLTAWSFQAEFVLATWLSSLFQAAVVCIGAPLAYRKLYAG